MKKFTPTLLTHADARYVQLLLLLLTLILFVLGGGAPLAGGGFGG
jgi:hypothetical protein